MKKLNKASLTTLMGTAVITSFAADVNAEANPFAMNELANGYMQMSEAGAKTGQGACGGNITNANGEAANVKKAEGACGEGKCGAMMNNGKMKAGMESTCGAMMKGKEGSCGMATGATEKKSAEMSCGAMMKGKDGSCGAMMKGGEGSCGAAVDPNKAAGK